MNNRIGSVVVFIGTVVAALLFRCSSGGLTGGGTEDVNTRVIVGSVLYPDGTPAPRAEVLLVPANHDPVRNSADELLTDTTDAAGGYTFRKKPGGIYNVIAAHLDTDEKLLISRVMIFEDDTTAVPPDTLRQTGSIAIELPETVDTANGYVFILGTAFFARASSYTVIDGLPAGIIPSVFYAEKTDTVNNHEVISGVNVDAGDTVRITDRYAWAYSVSLQLNTSPTGADVPNDVTDFPVLVRLTAPEFDFSEAMERGEDVRFVKSDGSALPHEIERWDPENGRAELWVKVDTVYGNDGTQSITLCWGNPDASGISNSAAVFDTSKGFQGVWHLGEAETETAKDATGNHYDGTPSDTVPAVAEGAIGPCRAFNGSSNYLRMNGTADSRLNFPENGTYSLSAWAYVDTLDNASHLIAGKGNEQYFLKFKYSLQEDPMVWEFVEYHDVTGWQITNSLPIVPTAKSWVFIAGVRMGNAQYFYLNGELVDSTIAETSADVPRSTADDVTIGRFLSVPQDSVEGISPFDGKVDEVRIGDRALGADWIKLCYMNQKEQDALVVFK